MRSNGGLYLIIRCCVLLLMVVALNGCSGMGGSSKSVDTPPPAADNELAPVTTMVESYGDIELPIEMTLQSKKSMAMRTDSFKGGIHIFTGNVQIASLRDYIVVSMRNNKWKMVGEASYNNVMLAFTTSNKTCMVVLASDTGMLGKTQASLYVTVDVAAVSRLNPFGEPIKQ